MNITPIKRVKVGEQVYMQLKKMLISGEWPQGSKIPSENELAEMFGVSRMTVRQALQKLNALGLLETRLGEGSFVKSVDAGETMNALIPTAYLGENSVNEVFEFRLIVETGSARLAAQRATKEDIRILKDIQRKLIQYDVEGEIKKFSKVDLEFHLRIAQISRNSLLIKTNGILQDVLARSMDEVIERMGYENALLYHKKIIDAIENRDEEMAEKWMKEHIEKNKTYFTKR